jgi:hypothetical protein
VRYGMRESRCAMHGQRACRRGGSGCRIGCAGNDARAATGRDSVQIRLFCQGDAAGHAENWRYHGRGSRLFVMGHMGLTGHISHIGPIRPI